MPIQAERLEWISALTLRPCRAWKVRRSQAGRWKRRTLFEHEPDPNRSRLSSSPGQRWRFEPVLVAEAVRHQNPEAERHQHHTRAPCDRQWSGQRANHRHQPSSEMNTITPATAASTSPAPARKGSSTRAVTVPSGLRSPTASTLNARARLPVAAQMGPDSQTSGTLWMATATATASPSRGFHVPAKVHSPEL